MRFIIDRRIARLVALLAARADHITDDRVSYAGGEMQVRLGVWGELARARMWVACLLVLAGGLVSPAGALAASSFSATEGQQFSGLVGSFSDPCHFDTTTRLYDCGGLKPSATINWGDGSSATPATVTPTGSCIAQPSCTYDVSGSHTYMEEGSFSTSITWSDSGSGSTVTAATAKVADAVPAAAPAGAITATEGAGLSNVQLAAFSDPGGGPASDFTATIDWGDNNLSPPRCPLFYTCVSPDGKGSISASAGGFSVTGNPSYWEAGSYTVTVTISDDGGASKVVQDTVTVGDASLSSTGEQVSATEGQLFSSAIASVADPNPPFSLPCGLIGYDLISGNPFCEGYDPTGDSTSSYAVAIDWGDGSPVDTTTGSAGGPGGTTPVNGSHTYAEEGTFPVTVTVTDDDGSQTVAHSTMTVGDAALSASPAAAISAAEGHALGNAQLATFTDARGGPASDFTATIDWGDGSNADTNGVIAPKPGGGFTVSGSHTYADEGSHKITVTIADKGGQNTQVADSMTVAQQPLMVTAAVVHATAGTPFRGAVANFIDPAPATTPSEYAATVDWGDGSTADATGLVTTSPGGGFQVVGSHTYSQPGAYLMSVVVHDGPDVYSGHASAQVSGNNGGSPAACLVPSVIGKTLAAATHAIAAADCKLGTVTRKPANKTNTKAASHKNKARHGAQASLRVLAQTPSAGTREPAGALVSLVVRR